MAHSVGYYKHSILKSPLLSHIIIIIIIIITCSPTAEYR